MPDPQKYPVPAASFISEYPTPDIRDFFVWERKDASAPHYELPDYGDKHHDAAKYPDHQFVRSVPEKDGNGYVIHVYAAVREDQELYNYGIDYPYGGSVRFPRYTRTYLTLREDYEAVALGTADTEFTTAVLVEQGVVRIEDSVLDSLFVLEKRVFEIIPDITDSTDLASARLFGYKVEYPYGVLDYPRVTWTVPNDSATAATPLDNTCPIAGFRDVIGEIQSPPMYLIGQTYMRDKQQVVGLSRIYERNPGPIIYSSEFEPRTGKPVLVSRQIIAASSVPDTVAELETELNGYGTVALTNIVNGLGTTSGVHGLTVGQEIYFSGASLGGSAAFINGTAGGTGAYFVKTVPTTSQFTFATTPSGAAFSGAGDDATGGTLYKRTLARGTVIEYHPMDMDKLRSIQVVSKLAVDSLDYLQGAADVVHQGFHNFAFPDQLDSLSWVWAWAASGSDFAFDIGLHAQITEGFRGACRARFTDRYTSNPAAPAFLAALPAPYVFLPEALSIPGGGYHAADGRAKAWIRIFTVPPTLHSNLTIGNPPTDPDIPGSQPTTTGATTPAAVPAATYIPVDVQAEKWRFGLWVYRIVEILTPY